MIYEIAERFDLLATNTANGFPTRLGQTVSLLIQKALTIPFEETVPPQYKFLGLLATRKTFLTLNLDCLAPHYLHRTGQVIELHGRIDRALTTHALFAELLEMTTDDFDLPEQQRVQHIYGKESPNLVETHVYRAAIPSIRQASAVVIIGYTFGKTAHGFDDDQTLEWLLYQTAKNQSSVFVIDPKPQNVTSVLADRLRRKVIALPLPWNVYCQAALSSDTSISDPESLIYRYNSLLEYAA